MALWGKHKKPSKQKTLLGQRTRRRRKVLVFFVCLFLCCAIGGVFALGHWERLHIHTVVVEESDYIVETDVENMVGDMLDGSYYYLIPRKHAVVYPRQEIIDVLLKTHPRVGEVNIVLHDFSEIRISFKTHEPYGLACLNDRECFYINTTGYVFDRAPHFSEDVYFRYYLSEKRVEDVIGSRIFTDDEFGNIDSFVQAIRDLGLEPLSLAGVSEGEPSIKLRGGGVILFDEEKPLSRQVNNLEHVIQDTETDLYPISSRRFDIGYIDLRFGDKIYFKLRASTTTPSI